MTVLSAAASKSTALEEALLEQAPAALLGLDASGTICVFNKSAARLFGYEQDEVLGNHFSLLFPGPGEPARLLRRAFSGAGLVEHEVPARKRDGSVFEVSMTSRAVRLGDGAVAVFSIADATAHGRTETAMRASEAMTRTLVEHFPDAVLLVRGDRVRWANEASAALFGAPEPASLGNLPLEDIFAPEHQDRGLACVNKALHAGMRVGPEELSIRRSDRLTCPVDITVVRIELPGGPAVQIVLRDLTEKKAMERELAQSDRLATVGVLAAGVAHEINNPLTYILSNIDYARRTCEQSDAPSEVRAALCDARTGALKMLDIVKGLGTFSHIEGDEPTLIDVHETLSSAINVARNEIRHRARLVKRYLDVPPVLGASGKLGQVFLNLLVNASHAIDVGQADKNEIVVTTQRSRDGSEVITSIQDTGSGIAPQDIKRIFDPFFTTKPVGAGTGLGLSICYNIVTSMGGRIEVSSRVGEGSTFTVILPAADAQMARGRARPTFPPPPASRRRMKILVIDDDSVVARSVRRMLQSEHSLALVRSGEEALQHLEHDHYDLVVCDVMMPEMTGVELYDHVQQQWPEQAKRFVFMTGGAFSSSTRAALEATERPCLHKPFTIGQLLTVLNRIADER